MMEAVVIGFKSGSTITIQVLDPEKFVNDVIAGPKKNPEIPVQYYTEPGIVINFSEVEFIIPAKAMKGA